MVRFLVVLLVVVISTVSLSEAQPVSGWGIGISIFDAQQAFEIGQTEGAAYNHSITVPIILNQGFRLEPEVGFFNGKSTEEYPASNETEEYTTTQYRIAVGIFPQSTMKSSVIYYGGRVGYLVLNRKYEESDPNSTQSQELNGSGIFIAPTVGGEYYFSNSFCIGAEAQFIYASINTEVDVTPAATGLPEFKDTLLSTRGLVFVRFFF
jgi:hypothetical protein